MSIITLENTAPSFTKPELESENGQCAEASGLDESQNHPTRERERPREVSESGSRTVSESEKAASETNSRAGVLASNGCAIYRFVGPICPAQPLRRSLVSGQPAPGGKADNRSHAGAHQASHFCQQTTIGGKRLDMLC